MARERIKKETRAKLASICYAVTRRGAVMAARERKSMTRAIRRALPNLRASDLAVIYLIATELGGGPRKGTR